MSVFHKISIWIVISVLFSLTCLSLVKSTNNRVHVTEITENQRELIKVFQEYVKTADQLYRKDK